MSNTLAVVGGIILVCFSFLILLSSMPVVYQELDTGAGSTFENATAIEKESLGAGRTFFSVMPILMFIAGFALVIKGL